MFDNYATHWKFFLIPEIRLDMSNCHISNVPEPPCSDLEQSLISLAEPLTDRKL